MAAVFIAEWKAVEQIFHREQPGAGEVGRAARPNTFQKLQWRREDVVGSRRYGVQSHSRCCGNCSLMRDLRTAARRAPCSAARPHHQLELLAFHVLLEDPKTRLLPHVQYLI